jgi:O-6-methylguanine DNA methyltransferase
MAAKRTDTLYYRAVETPVGRIEAWATDRGVRYVDLPGGRPPKLPRDAGSCRHLDRLAKAVTSYFGGKGRRFDVPVDVEATPFQQLVWDEMRRIPFGRTRTYGELAEAIGRPTSARAVGNACSKNPVPLIVPCHRVVGRSGAGGWSGRPGLKESLLEIEGVV